MKKFLSRTIAVVTLVLFMFSSFSAVIAADDRIVVSTVRGTAENLIPVYGNNATPKPAITVTEGSPAYFVIDGANGNWYKRNADASVTRLEKDDSFTEGTYYFYCQVRIDGTNGTTHVLNKDGIDAYVDGIKWKSGTATIDDRYSYIWVTSPDYVVTAPAEAPLQFVKGYEIGTNSVGKAITAINVSGGVTGGKAPYTFSKVSGPDWLTVSSDGIISGTPSAVGANAALVVRVTDSKSNTADVTINVATTVPDPKDRTVVRTVRGTAENLIPVYGNNATPKPAITVTEGSPAYFVIDGANGNWYKRNADASVTRLEKDDSFTEGTYYFYCQVRIYGASGTTHVLNKDGIDAYVDGIKWKSDTATIDDRYSYIWVTSPDYVVTAPAEAPLQFVKGYEIGTNSVGKAITAINVSGGVTGGKAPYTFSKVSGPDWLTVSSDGIISGTPSAVGANAALVVRVTDSKSNTADVTINVATTVPDPKDRTVVRTVRGTAENLIPVYGNNATPKPAITVTEGSPAYFVIDGANGNWYKRNADASVTRLEKDDSFTEGTYYFYCQVRIDGASGTTHVLNKDGIDAYVDGIKWKSDTATIDDRYSYIWVTSPDYVVTASGTTVQYGLKYINETLTASVGTSGNYTVIFAGSEADGRLSHIETSVQYLEVGVNKISIPSSVDMSKVNKICLWKDFASMKPACGALEIN